MKQAGLFGLSDHLKRLSVNGDPLEELDRIVDFEGFSPILENALAYSDGAKGGRPPYDCVAIFKILILAAQNNVTDARMEYLIRDRLSWLRTNGYLAMGGQIVDADLSLQLPSSGTHRRRRMQSRKARRLTRSGQINQPRPRKKGRRCALDDQVRQGSHSRSW